MSAAWDREDEDAYKEDARERLALEFTTIVMRKPMHSPTGLDKVRRDYSKTLNGLPTWRSPTVGEVIYERMDLPSAPSWDELFALWIRVANAGDAEAVAMLKRLADVYAEGETT